MKFYDMDGNELNIGDHILPIEGPEHRIISIGNVEGFEDEVMIGQQLENLAVFAILTADNLAAQFRKSGSDNPSEAEEILDIIMGGGES